MKSAQEQIQQNIRQIENEKLRETLETVDDLRELDNLKKAFPEYEEELATIEILSADEDQQIQEEKLLDDKGRPDHASIFHHLNRQYHFIHYLSRQGERTERILAYKDGYYQFGGEGLIKQKFQSLLPSKVSTHHKQQVVDRGYDHRMGKKGDTKNTLYDNLVDLNSPEWKLNFRNGILDIKSRELEDHNPKKRFTNQIPYEYDPDAETEICEDFLEEVLINPEVQIKKLQEFFGYSLKHWATDFEKAGLLIGDTNSGKGVILSVFKAMLGDENVSQMSLKDIVDTPFGNQQILGKMANVNNDLNHHEITNTGTAKNAISGEDVVVNEKHKPKFVAEPQAKHFYSANFPPRDRISDEAYYGRWLTFRVPKSIPPEEQDRQLRGKLKKEIQGILNWSLEGLERLEDQGSFTGERSPEEVKDLWRKYGDPLAQFYHHAIKRQRGKHIKQEVAYDLYQQFCEELGKEPESKHSFTKYITNQHRNINSTQRYDSGWGRKADVYEGVCLIDDAYEKLMSAAD